MAQNQAYKSSYKIIGCNKFTSSRNSMRVLFALLVLIVALLATVNADDLCGPLCYCINEICLGDSPSCKGDTCRR
ncbi:hypothetical protein BOX15_Mlig010575g1 [Macrostomum lignano]|uniref:Uncharacterized protein n=1 Tax=Macrostomum lignano TaxID=282301 RepID=A0A267FMJ6_9PLAT|nr:hypothetical protein BOX15_Mlig015871g1 [Macrostomum lignano]PAA75016.1 hypothetical protein BOX15_Mlig015871g3 [Macrostomum lignano]PAA75017.1 hypothetical protein BOX15_Mlig015871g2 [Macrostomum lignano]PAA75018.1 hypothetical protein BOX15_Mlig010575g1 [Macrostomum lignano]